MALRPISWQRASTAPQLFSLALLALPLASTDNRLASTVGAQHRRLASPDRWPRRAAADNHPRHPGASAVHSKWRRLFAFPWSDDTHSTSFPTRSDPEETAVGCLSQGVCYLPVLSSDRIPSFDLLARIPRPVADDAKG